MRMEHLFFDRPHHATGANWCDAVRQARSDLTPELKITVPCETMKPAKSAVVCFLTAGVADGQGNHKVFTGSDYINGALALGASLQDHITRKDTHQLLLIRDGFTIPDDKLQMLKAVGWTLGKAPKVDVEDQYIPRFERYKTLYTKISVIGLSEYDCVLMLDADVLAVGNLDNLMSCDILQPNYQVAGTLDYYHRSWYHFNTGSALWRPSSEEMNRVYGLTKDPNFMRRFESDQIFTNAVYPDRTDKVKNAKIMDGSDHSHADWGRVADLGWQYNAQTHVEYQLPSFFEEHLKDVKIIHFTQFKGWQCPEQHGGPPNPKIEFPTGDGCTKIPGCACNEGYRWWDYLAKARAKAASQAIAL